MEAAVEERSGFAALDRERATLETELEGDFQTGAELMELCVRMMPLYYARYGDVERAHVASLAGEELSADATRLWEREIFEHFDLRPLLGRLTMPTLVITGEKDFITGPVCAAEFSEGIPAAETVVVPGAGHMIQLEAPQAVNHAIARWLARPAIDSTQPQPVPLGEA